MAKYFDLITEATHLKHNTGSNIVVPLEFHQQSSTIFSQCIFLQNLIQQIIYTAHGGDLLDAKKTLKEFPSPKARVEFLCSFPFDQQDPIVDTVFSFCRTLFRDIYGIRNVLAHELWSSSEEYKRSVLFSKLDENSRLFMTSGKLWYYEDATPEDIYDATVRFIRSVKIVTCDHLKIVIEDINLCSWSLMNINNILTEEDPQKKDDARKAFLVFEGTSHLFHGDPVKSEIVTYSASKKKSISK